MTDILTMNLIRRLHIHYVPMLKDPNTPESLKQQALVSRRDADMSSGPQNICMRFINVHTFQF